MAFTISIPVEAPFLELVPALAGKYTELAGGSAADATALAASVASEVERLTSATEGQAVIELVFVVDTRAIDVTLRCDGRSVSVRQPVPARKA